MVWGNGFKIRVCKESVVQIPGTLAIKLAKAAETAVKEGHPWVFEQSIEKGR